MPSGIPGVVAMRVQTIRNGVVVVNAVVPDRSGPGGRLIPLLYRVSNGTYTRLPGADVHVKNSFSPSIDGGDLEMADANAHGWIVGPNAANAPTLYTPSTGPLSLPMATTPGKYTAIQDMWISDSGTTLGGYAGADGPVTWSCH